MAAIPPGQVITIRDMRIDDVDGGLPKITFKPYGGDVEHTFALAPDAVAGIVDALSGVAPAPAGEARIVVKVRVEDLAKVLPEALKPTRTIMDRGVPAAVRFTSAEPADMIARAAAMVGTGGRVVIAEGDRFGGG